MANEGVWKRRRLWTHFVRLNLSIIQSSVCLSCDPCLTYLYELGAMAMHVRIYFPVVDMYIPHQRADQHHRATCRPFCAQRLDSVFGPQYLITSATMPELARSSARVYEPKLKHAKLPCA